MEAMRQRGTTPVGLWKIINALAKAENPDHRAQRRCWQLRFWGACRELRKAGLLFRHGPLIATSRFATMPKPRKRDRGASRPYQGELLSPSVGKSTSKIGGSSPTVPMVQMAINGSQRAGDKLVGPLKPVVTCLPETKSAAPTMTEISAAAADLAQRRRKRTRIWSGWLDPHTRVWRGRRIILPDGQLAYAYGCLRKKLVWSFHPDGLHGGFDEPFEWGVLPAHCIRVYRDPKARLLGSLKAGVIERKSEAKAHAARRNGLRPTREGRRRGRPPRSSAQLTAFV